MVKGLFADTENASSYFVSSMSSDKVDDAMRGVVSDSDVAIDGMDKSMSNSTVYVTASTPEGGGSVLHCFHGARHAWLEGFRRANDVRLPAVVNAATPG